jgi:hypothetical protein
VLRIDLGRVRLWWVPHSIRYGVATSLALAVACATCSWALATMRSGMCPRSDVY